VNIGGSIETGTEIVHPRKKDAENPFQRIEYSLSPFPEFSSHVLVRDL